MLPEGGELNIPVRLQLVQPGLHGDHGLRPEPEEAQSRILRDPLVGDDARLEQNPQVPAHRRGGHADRGSELAGPARSLAQQLHDVQPGRVGERAEDDRHARGVWPIIRHEQNS